ncbi:MAG: polymer-forming cytoskeletal protein [Bacteroidales bacterium]|nr:polymer-forming cytoskeletal protein [Bacteroidales bacterium]
MARTSYEMESNTVNTLSNGTVITGNITAQGDFRLDGTLNGDITINGRLVIGESGVINGNITCVYADVDGSVKGNINVKEQLSLRSTASIKGDIIINKLAIEPGASFSGTCRMVDELKKAETTESTEQY